MASNPNQFLINLDAKLREEHSELLCVEEEFWVMKSRIGYLVDGDHNTSFYHTSVLARCRKNKIVSLKNDNGEWITEEEEVANHIRQ